MSFRPIVFLLVVMGISLASCEKHLEETYEEPITSLFYVLTPDTGESVVLSYLDRDGIGGRPPLVNSAVLQPSTSYSAKLYFNSMALARIEHLSDSTTVAQAPSLHQVFFLPLNNLQVETSYTDQDEIGYPIGLETRLTTGTTSEGEIKLVVVHNPDKTAENVIVGNVANAGGSIDFETHFSVTIAN